MEEVLSLMKTELTNTRLQLQSAQEEIVCLRGELSAQQQRLLEAQEVIELESAKVKKLAAEKESLQRHLQLPCSQVHNLQEEVKRGKEELKSFGR